MGTGKIDRQLEPLCWNWIGLDADPIDSDQQMPFDEAIFTRVGQGTERSTVRLYRWRTSAVTFGRLQSEESVRATYPALPAFRRPTGGRAVVHGDDLTISIAASNADLAVIGVKLTSVMSVYNLLIEPVAFALKQLGMNTDTGIKRRVIHAGSDEGRRNLPVDCFETVAKCDIVDAEYGIKRLGSALRRSSSAVLLQMSLRPMPQFDIFGEPFTGELRTQLERYLKIGTWHYGFWTNVADQRT